MKLTDEEESIKALDNMLNRKERKLSCKNCFWSGFVKGDEYITCGHHHDNFTSNSFCSYHTKSNDPKLLEYLNERQERARQIIENRRNTHEVNK